MVPPWSIAVIAAVGLLMTGGCTASQVDRVERGIDRSRTFQETMGKVDHAVFCSQTITALLRLYTLEERNLILKICEPRDGP